MRHLVFTTYRFGNLLKTKCLIRRQHRGSQNTSGPGNCSDLEHTSSTDCVFSLTFDFRPVFCLVIRHRNLLSAVWVWPQSKLPCWCFDLYSKSATGSES